MAQYPTKDSNGRPIIVRVDPNGDRSRRKPVERQEPKDKKKKS